jgi:hypothetical protein
MRTLLPAIGLSVLALFPSSSNASDRLRQITVFPDTETYRGYYINLAEISGRQNFNAIANALRHQLDIVENVGLSPSVLKFFHTIPIIAGEVACLTRPPDHPPTELPAIACYVPPVETGWVGPRAHVQWMQHPVRVFTVLDGNKSEWVNPDPIALAEDTGLGLVMTRPLVHDGGRPTMLHELLHAFHHHMMPKGTQNPEVLLYYNHAKGENLYSADAYLLTNEREYFAVTASVFLYGKDGPLTRSDLKQTQPDYYKYLARLFEHDPDGVPVASRTLPTPAKTVQVQ